MYYDYWTIGNNDMFKNGVGGVNFSSLINTLEKRNIHVKIHFYKRVQFSTCCIVDLINWFVSSPLVLMVLSHYASINSSNLLSWTLNIVAVTGGAWLEWNVD